MLSNLTQFNHIVFQLVKFNTETKISTEILVVSLAVMPTDLNYTYTSRSAIAQTRGNNEVDGFRETYGRGLTRVSINGTFGYKNRMSGLQWKSGWNRLVEFRELVFKLSNLQQGQSKRKILGVNTAVYDKSFLKDNEVIVVNFFDFFNQEKFAVNLDTFNIIESAMRNNLPSYQLTLTEISDYVFTLSNDLVLNALLKYETIIGNVLQAADEILNNISADVGLQAFAQGYTYVNLALESLGKLPGAANSVIDLAKEAGQVLTGKAAAKKLSGFKSIFG